MKILRKKLDEGYGDILVCEVEGEKNTYQPATIAEILHAENTVIEYYNENDRHVDMVLDGVILHAHSTILIIPITLHDLTIPAIMEGWEIKN